MPHSHHIPMHCVARLAALSLVIFFLRRPWAVQSPHLRAQLGQVLFHVFIPHRDRGQSVRLWMSEFSAQCSVFIYAQLYMSAQSTLADTLCVVVCNP